MHKPVAGLWQAISSLVHEGSALGGASEKLFARFEKGCRCRGDGDAVFRVPDRGRKEVLEGQLSEALMHGLDACHEAGNQGLAPFRPLRRLYAKGQRPQVVHRNALWVGLAKIRVPPGVQR